MNSNSRACVAYIAGRWISNKIADSIYDFSQSRNIAVDGYVFQQGISVDNHEVEIFDYDRGCEVIGDYNGKTLSLYDYGEAAPINLVINGSAFHGYCYRTSSNFEGKVGDELIEFYDYENRCCYFYNFNGL